MAITFPSSPTIGDTHLVGNTLYTWDGVSWDSSFSDDTESVAVRLNTAKVGITPQQASNILTNNAKVGADAQATNQGNIFNGNEQLVKTDSAGRLPAIDGSQLTGIDGSEWSYVAEETTTTTDSMTVDSTWMGESFDWETYIYRVDIMMATNSGTILSSPSLRFDGDTGDSYNWATLFSSNDITPSSYGAYETDSIQLAWSNYFGLDGHSKTYKASMILERGIFTDASDNYITTVTVDFRVQGIGSGTVEPLNGHGFTTATWENDLATETPTSFTVYDALNNGTKDVFKLIVYKKLRGHTTIAY